MIVFLYTSFSFVSLYISLDLHSSLYLFFTESCLLYLNIRGKSLFPEQPVRKPGDQGAVEQVCSTQIFCWLILPPSAHMWNYSTLWWFIIIHSLILSVRIIFATTITTTKRGLKIYINNKSWHSLALPSVVILDAMQDVLQVCYNDQSNCNYILDILDGKNVT